MTDRRRQTQPVRAPTGGDYGARRQLEGAQQAVPLPDNTAPAAPGGPAGGGQGPMVQRPDVFGPTARPDEAINQGAGPEGFGMLPEDPVEVLRAIYLRYPSPGLRKLMERSAVSPEQPTSAPEQM